MIEKKSLADLTNIEYKALYAANYGYNGYMRSTLVDNKGNPDGFALMVWDGPHDTQKNLKAWALVVPVSIWGEAGGTYYTKTRSKYTVMFWVKRPHRKQGLGTLLMQEVKKYDARPHCFPHDEKSGEFLSSYDITTTREERVWLKNKPRVA